MSRHRGLESDLLSGLHAALQVAERGEAHRLEDALARPPGEQIAAGVRWPALHVDVVRSSWRGVELTLRGKSALHGGIREGDRVRVDMPGGVVAEGRVLAVDSVPPTAVIEVRDAEVDPDHGDRLVLTRMHDASTFIRFRQALEKADQWSSPLKTALLDADVAVGEPGDGVLQISAGAELDPAQARAAAVALSGAPLAAIHGPPGTGKTWLLGHLLAETVRRGERPWALAESNAAVDNLAATAKARGLDVVRLGHPARVRADLQDLTVDARLARGPLASALKALERELQRVSGSDRAAWQTRKRLRRELRGLREQAWSHAVSGAAVVACTLGTLARVASRLEGADVAFVDEATQATEPAVWVAVPWVKRLVLVGDPEQLGPVVKEANSPLEDSALQRVLMQSERSAPMLEVQHRMSAAVQQLVQPIYGPAYRPHASVDNAVLTDVPGVRETPLTSRSHLFIDTAGTGAEEVRDPVSLSLENMGEVRIVVAVVDQLVAAGVAPEHIGIITPYSAQVARLRDALPAIESASVNAWQGREKPVIVMSWVRSNEDGTVGFVADGRRLTVAWSRARMLLVQVGDLATLAGVPRFAWAAKLLEDRGDLQSAWEPPWADVL